MDKTEILLVLEAISADNVQEGSRNVQCSCFLAPWRKGHRSDTDSRPSMGISIDPYGESKVHCFACEYGGTLKRAVEDFARLSGEDFGDLINRVGDYEDVDPSILADTIPDYDDFEKPKPEVKLGDSILEGIAGQAHRYVMDRGFDLETLKEWESGYDKDHKRAVFPVRNSDGFLVGAVGRTVNGHKVKYFNYFGFDKSRYLFGEHKIVDGTTVVVVEGLLDTIKVWQKLRDEELLGRYSVVGLLGSDASKKQCQKLMKFSNEVVLFLDNDQAGLLGQNKLALNLQKKVLLKSVEYPSNIGNDPDDVVENGGSLGELFDTSKLIVAKRGMDWR